MATKLTPYGEGYRDGAAGNLSQILMYLDDQEAREYLVGYRNGRDSKIEYSRPSYYMQETKNP